MTQSNQHIQDLFFLFLRKGLWRDGGYSPTEHLTASALSEVCQQLSEKDWKRLVEMARRQTVLGILYDGIQQANQASLLPDSVRSKMLPYCYILETTYHRMNEVLIDLNDQFLNNDLPFVLLKGQGLASNYLISAHRQCGDIDVYVGEEDYEKAKDFVLKAGLTIEEEEEECEKHLNFAYQDINVEVHRQAAILFRKKYNPSFQQWSRESLLGSDYFLKFTDHGQPIQLPEPTYNAFFVFYHMYHHLLHGGVGLRQLCDWACLLDRNHGLIDRDLLQKRLKDYRLMIGWQAMGYILVNYLGLSPEKMPYYTDEYAKSAPAILDRLFKDGNFGQYRQSKTARPKGLIRGKLYSFIQHIRRYTSCFVKLPFKADVLASFWQTIYIGVQYAFVDGTAKHEQVQAHRRNKQR